MPHHAELRHSPYSPQELYQLALDVERYPEFLPWCRAARITERGPDYFIGELLISFSGLTERYSSKVTSVAPNATSPGSIDVTLVQGPFKHLTNRWSFAAKEGGGTEIHFDVDFKFKSLMLEKLIGGVFTRAVEKMSAAFLTRAEVLYGPREV